MRKLYSKFVVGNNSHRTRYKNIYFFRINSGSAKDLLKKDVCLMVFNATFNNILDILWQSVLLMEETTDLSQVIDKLYHIMLYTSPWSRFELKTSVVILTDCIGSCKSNYHTITATMAPNIMKKHLSILLYTAIMFNIN